MAFDIIQVMTCCEHCDYFTHFLVLVAHNGFPFDFIFLVAEVKRRKLDETFDSINIHFADTLYDARRVSLFTLVSPQYFF